MTTIPSAADPDGVLRIEVPKSAPWSFNVVFPLGALALVIQTGIMIAMWLTGGFHEVMGKFTSIVGFMVLPVCGTPLAVAGLVATRTHTCLQLSNRCVSVTRDRWGRVRQWQWDWTEVSDATARWAWVGALKIRLRNGKNFEFILAADQGFLATTQQMLVMARTGKLAESLAGSAQTAETDEPRTTRQAEDLPAIALHPPFDGKDLFGMSLLGLLAALIAGMSIWTTIEVLGGRKNQGSLIAMAIVWAVFAIPAYVKIWFMRRRHTLSVRDGKLIIGMTGLWPHRTREIPAVAIQTLGWGSRSTSPDHKDNYIAILPFRGYAIEIPTGATQVEIEEILEAVSKALGLVEKTGGEQ